MKVYILNRLSNPINVASDNTFSTSEWIDGAKEVSIDPTLPDGVGIKTKMRMPSLGEIDIQEGQKEICVELSCINTITIDGLSINKKLISRIINTDDYIDPGSNSLENFFKEVVYKTNKATITYTVYEETPNLIYTIELPVAGGSDATVVSGGFDTKGNNVVVIDDEP